MLSGGGEKKTKVKKRTLDPEWNEAIDFEGLLEGFVGTGLTLKLYDWDRIGFDDALGELSVDLRVLEGQSHVELVRQLPTQGVCIHIHSCPLTVCSFTAADARSAPHMHMHVA